MRGSGSAPTFRSILYHDGAGDQPSPVPAHFRDLNLDQIVAAVTAGREEYDLAPLFHDHLQDPGAILYRQDVLRDLQGAALAGHLAAFAERMREVRAQLSQAGKLRYRRQQQGWFLTAVETYAAAISALSGDLAALELTSLGMRSFREYLADYVASPQFTALAAEARAARAALVAIGYCLQIQGLRVTVSRYLGEPDYSVDVLATFEKFKQRGAKDHRVGFPSWPEMNHVEAAILDLVVKLHPESFAKLDAFCTGHHDFLAPTVARFDREAQFYLAYLEHMARFTAVGLRFSYPEVSREAKEVFARETFDLALADKLVATGAPVVVNDFHLEAGERVLLVTGPNHGGKTTFARTFGQLHHLALLGLPVPGSSSRLFPIDQLFTHFERQEDFADLRGKLEDDLVRIREVLDLATGDSLIVINEIFSSTTLSDARLLGTRVLEQIVRSDALCVYVSFVDELAALGPSIVSLVSQVVAENPAERTYKVVRQPANGLAYAIAIAERYGLSYDSLRRRISP